MRRGKVRLLIQVLPTLFRLKQPNSLERHEKGDVLGLKQQLFVEVFHLCNFNGVNEAASLKFACLSIVTSFLHQTLD